MIYGMIGMPYIWNNWSNGLMRCSRKGPQEKKYSLENGSILSFQITILNYWSIQYLIMILSMLRRNALCKRHTNIPFIILFWDGFIFSNSFEDEIIQDLFVKWVMVTWQGWEGTTVVVPVMTTRRHTLLYFLSLLWLYLFQLGVRDINWHEWVFFFFKMWYNVLVLLTINVFYYVKLVQYNEYLHSIVGTDHLVL